MIAGFEWARDDAFAKYVTNWQRIKDFVNYFAFIRLFEGYMHE